MNKNIISKEIQDFINDNLKSDINKLILKGSPFEDITIQELAQQIEGKKKAFKKLPLWFETEGIYFPPKLNLEQTSSETTAQYKAGLVSGNSLIDLTGGFGIDCTYFSKVFQEVHHCEMNEELSDIVSYNNKIFNFKNIHTHKGNSLEILKKLNTKHDCIYVDPSRRHDVKGKVFLLNDCVPNIPKNLDFLFEYTDKILVKNSPILDITSTINELNFVKEVHIIAVQNEVKEFLILLEKKYSGAIKISTKNILKESQQDFSFEYNSSANSIYGNPENFLYEPNAAILKSGAFHNITESYPIKKLQQHTHLYTSEKLVENFPGRIFKINDILNYDKKKLIKSFPEKKANITIRNFPETVAKIRKKIKFKEGGDTYLFFATNQENKKIVISCSKA